jgi:ABC-2 type transport system permease protein
MMQRIIRHDWATLRADATLWLVAVITIAAVGYGAWNGMRWVQFQQQALAQVAHEEQERYEALDAQIEALNRSGEQISPFADPRNPSTLGARRGVRSAMLPPAPLAAFAIGQSDLLPYYLQVSTAAREAMLAATELENPYRLLVGRFDLAFVIIYLYPLLILGLTYNLLSAEREDGTLALVLSQPVTVGTLVAGKVALRLAVLLALVVGSAMMAALVGTAGHATHGVGVRVLLWAVAVAGYGGFWFALAVLVMSFGRSSASNATALASAWLVLVVLVPALLNLVLNAVYPVPSRVQMVQAVREASDEASTRGSQLLAQYLEDHPELAGEDEAGAAGDFASVRVAVADAVEREVRPIIETYEQQRARQERFVASVRFLSPAILMQDALNDLSGTGTARHRHFVAQVDTFHDAWRAYFTRHVLQRTRIGSLDDVPAFTYEDERTSAMAARVGVSVLGLVLPAGVIGGIGTARLRRYPVIDG